MMNIIDIKAVSELSKKHKIILAVNNTFATPYLQQPLDLGADIVMHSATKYLGGHSDVVMGALVVNDKELADRLYFIQNASDNKLVSVFTNFRLDKGNPPTELDGVVNVDLPFSAEAFTSLVATDTIAIY